MNNETLVGGSIPQEEKIEKQDRELKLREEVLIIGELQRSSAYKRFKELIVAPELEGLKRELVWLTDNNKILRTQGMIIALDRITNLEKMVEFKSNELISKTKED